MTVPFFIFFVEKLQNFISDKHQQTRHPIKTLNISESVPSWRKRISRFLKIFQNWNFLDSEISNYFSLKLFWWTSQKSLNSRLNLNVIQPRINMNIFEFEHVPEHTNVSFCLFYLQNFTFWTLNLITVVHRFRSSSRNVKIWKFLNRHEIFSIFL